MFVATDLHGHTRFSDGRVEPEEFVDFRGQFGIRVIAVTDHDVMGGVRAATRHAEHLPMLVIPGGEMTSFRNYGTPDAEPIHVLAYYPPSILASARFEETFFYRRGQRVQAKWQAFVLNWLDQLDEDDRHALDPEGELSFMGAEAFPGAQRMLDRIMARRRNLFAGFWDHRLQFWMTEKELFGWRPEELVEAIRGDGAVDIVAHPGQYTPNESTSALLDYATGFEAYTSRHGPDAALFYRELATRRKKLWTASVDDHQVVRYKPPKGGTPVSTLERLLGQAVPAFATRAA